jgi:hypothetical protein
MRAAAGATNLCAAAGLNRDDTITLIVLISKTIRVIGLSAGREIFLSEGVKTDGES